MKKIAVRIVVTIATILLGACSKELSTPPQDRVVDANAIIDQSTAENVLNGAYFRLAGGMTNNATDWSGHEIPGSLYAGFIGNGYGAPFPDESNSIQMGNKFGQGIWQNCYQLVEASNNVIKGVTALDAKVFTGNRRNEMLAEARFLRAYANYRLLSYFAQWWDISSRFGILIRREASAVSKLAQGRSDVRTSYDFINADLDYAIANAAVSRPPYYATRWAAMALKMRVLISRAGADDYQQVISLAETIRQSGRYKLENNLKDLFYVKGLSSAEVILGIQPNSGQEKNLLSLSRAYYPGQVDLWVAKQTLKDLLATDPRGKWMVGAASDYTLLSPGTWYFQKYIAYGAQPSQLSETSYVFRLSEVYLLESEAVIRSGGNLQQARQLLRAVMSGAGVTDFTALEAAATTDELLMQNYLEIVRNLLGEDGADWMALLRLPLAVVSQLKPSISSKQQYILPLPADEFIANPGIGEQNPGYAQ